MKRSQSLPQKKLHGNRQDSDSDIKVISRSASQDTVLRNSDGSDDETDDEVMQKKYASQRQRVYSAELFNPTTQSQKSLGVKKAKSRPAVAAPIPRARTRSYSVKVQETSDRSDRNEYATSHIKLKNDSVNQPRENEYAVSSHPKTPAVEVARASPTPMERQKTAPAPMLRAESHQPNVIVNLYANGEIDATSIRPQLESAVRQVLESEGAQSVLRPILAEANVMTGRRGEWAVDHATSTSGLAKEHERFTPAKKQQSLPSVSPRSKNSPLTGGSPRSILTHKQGSTRSLQGSRIQEEKMIKKISGARLSTQNSQKILDEIIGPSMTPPGSGKPSLYSRTSPTRNGPLGGTQLRDKLSHISADIGQAHDAREKLKLENMRLKKKISALSLRLDHANTSNFKPASAWTTVCNIGI
jgi:hypothetical protein